MAIEYQLSYTAREIDEKLGKIDSLVEKNELPTKLSDLTNDSGFITNFTETDPTVPSWAKQPNKPTYTASEVGALPADTVIPTVPTNVSAFNNDAGYLTEHQSLAGLATETYVNNKIAAIPTPDVSGQINTHNTATDSHNDIRLLVEGLTTRLNTLANSDDTTLDQMSEVVAYIKNNKSLIEGVTNNKVNVSDIIDNLTTNVSNKPLSASQGVALKALIDAIIVPTKVSQLENDSKYLTSVPSEYVTESELNAKKYLTSYTETDPTVPSWAKASSKPTYTKSEVGLGNVDDVRQYSANNPPPYPVTSVNGKTGAVTIDVPTVPTKVSAFTNDAGYLTEISKTEIVQQVIAALPVYNGEVV